MFHSRDFHLLHFLDKIENQWWTGRVLEGLCCHWELCLNGRCLLWAWSCSSRGFSFPDRILSRIGLPSSPCLAQSGCVLWQSLHSVLTATSSCAVESSGVPGRWVLLQLCPSLRDTRQALFSVWLPLLIQWNGRMTLRYLTGWLTLSLFIESKGFFWISMVFYIQRIANMIADLV